MALDPKSLWILGADKIDAQIIRAHALGLMEGPWMLFQVPDSLAGTGYDAHEDQNSYPGKNCRGKTLQQWVAKNLQPIEIMHSAPLFLQRQGLPCSLFRFTWPCRGYIHNHLAGCSSE
jgi:hypothetical protein